MKGSGFFHELKEKKVGKSICSVCNKKGPKVPNKCLVSVKRPRSRSGFVIFFFSYFKDSSTKGCKNLN